MSHDCPTGKLRYDGPQEATNAALRIIGRNGFNASAYHCNLCGGWHISGHTRSHKRMVEQRTKPKAKPYNRHDRSWLREVEL